MNTFRAKQIADYFATAGAFEITNKLHGLEVSFRDQTVYFEEEASFWPFLYYLAQAVHQEQYIGEAESKLAA